MVFGLTLLGLLLYQSLLVLMHEAGHYTAAKLCGVQTLQFIIGRGPLLFRWRPRETEFEIRLLPMGGGVRLSSSDTSAGTPEPRMDSRRSMESRSLGQRMFIVLAGPFANLTFSLLLLWGVYSAQGAVGLSNAPSDTGPAQRAITSLVEETRHTTQGIASWLIRLDAREMPLLYPALQPPRASVPAHLLDEGVERTAHLLNIGLFLAGIGILVSWLNLLPLPRLDGGLLVLLLFEGLLRGKTTPLHRTSILSFSTLLVLSLWISDAFLVFSRL